MGVPAVCHPSVSNDTCLWHIKKGILHHIFTEWKYIIRPRLHIISHRRYIIICLPSKAVLYQAFGLILLWNLDSWKGQFLFIKKRRRFLYETSPVAATVYYNYIYPKLTRGYTPPAVWFRHFLRHRQWVYVPTRSEKQHSRTPKQPCPDRICPCQFRVE